jgi:Arc/MetJ family transcription regulator
VLTESGPESGDKSGIKRCYSWCRRNPCERRLLLDDDLIRTAQEYTGLVEKSALMREAHKALIEREAARRLAALGGASPAMASIPRRRAKAE